MVDQDENESGNPGHTHPGAYALLWRGGFYRERGESRAASRLTYFSESEEDLSSHLMTLNKKELLSMLDQQQKKEEKLGHLSRERPPSLRAAVFHF